MMPRNCGRVSLRSGLATRSRDRPKVSKQRSIARVVLRKSRLFLRNPNPGTIGDQAGPPIWSTDARRRRRQTCQPRPSAWGSVAQSLVKNAIHLVFSTKNRRPWLKEKIRPRLFAYLAGIFQQWECPAIVIGGHDDHVHPLFLLSKNYALKDIVEEVKKGSSKWIKTLGAEMSGFSWQNGYGAFSVSESKIAEVRIYTERQEEHHQRMTFQDELRQLFARHGIDVDERYLWS